MQSFTIVKYDKIYESSILSTVHLLFRSIKHDNMNRYDNFVVNIEGVRSCLSVSKESSIVPLHI